VVDEGVIGGFAGAGNLGIVVDGDCGCGLERNGSRVLRVLVVLGG
jgi:hypothetical protein